MSNKIFVGDEGTTIVLNCGQDISTATAAAIKYRKPNGTEGQWSASVYNSNYLKYVTSSGDIDMAGSWILQAYVEMPAWTGLGDSIVMRVLDPFD